MEAQAEESIYQIGKIIQSGKRSFMILKLLKNKLKVREVFLKTEKKTVGMSMGDFYEIPLEENERGVKAKTSAVIPKPIKGRSSRR